MPHRIIRATRRGFTLVEVLVTLVLIALLIGVIVPSVINQLDRGDPTRVMSDLEGIRSGVKMFRIDVKRYPSTLEQLTVHPNDPDGDDDWMVWTDSGSFPTNGTINEGLKQMWNGPYIEGVVITAPTTETYSTALGGEILGEFAELDLGGVTYLVIQVEGLTQGDIQNLDDEFDDGVLTSGRIQRVQTAVGPPEENRLDFYAVPLN